MICYHYPNDSNGKTIVGNMWLFRKETMTKIISGHLKEPLSTYTHIYAIRPFHELGFPNGLCESLPSVSDTSSF